MSDASTILQTAYRYASAGLKVIPVPFRTKAPKLVKWHERATTDSEQLEEWFGGGQASNLGLVMGGGIVALDVDVKSGGISTLAALEQEHGPLPITPTQITGSGGRHYLFHVPPLGDVKLSNRTGFRPGLDLKADNGQIIAAPSQNAEGGEYHWLPGRAPDEVPFADIPSWLLMMVVPVSKPRGTATGKVGERNVTLHRAGSRMRGRGAEQLEIEAALVQLNGGFSEPLDAAEVGAVVKSVLKYPRGVAPYHWNDSGNAQRFMDEHQTVLRFATDARVWLRWNGKCWQIDNAGAVTRLFQEMVQAMRMEAEDLDGSTPEAASFRKAAINWARKSGDASKVAGGLKLSETDPRIAVQLSSYDDLPGLLAVDNGVIDLKTGRLLPHDPARAVTKVCPVPYNPEAKAPRWLAHIQFAVPAELGLFIQTYLGYSLMGAPVEQRFVVFKGEGGNGKSVITSVVAGVVGPFVEYTSAETFLAMDNASKGGTRPDLLALRGARLVLATEVPSRRKLDALTIKSIAGGEPIVARQLYSKTVSSFPVTFTTLALTNPYPGADEGDGGLWRRLLGLPPEK